MKVEDFNYHLCQMINSCDELLDGGTDMSWRYGEHTKFKTGEAKVVHPFYDEKKGYELLFDKNLEIDSVEELYEDSFLHPFASGLAKSWAHKHSRTNDDWDEKTQELIDFFHQNKDPRAEDKGRFLRAVKAKIDSCKSLYSFPPPDVYLGEAYREDNNRYVFWFDEDNDIWTTEVAMEQDAWNPNHPNSHGLIAWALAYCEIRHLFGTNSDGKPDPDKVAVKEAGILAFLNGKDVHEAEWKKMEELRAVKVREAKAKQFEPFLKTLQAKFNSCQPFVSFPIPEVSLILRPAGEAGEESYIFWNGADGVSIAVQLIEKVNANPHHPEIHEAITTILIVHELVEAGSPDVKDEFLIGKAMIKAFLDGKDYRKVEQEERESWARYRQSQNQNVSSTQSHSKAVSQSPVIPQLNKSKYDPEGLLDDEEAF